MHPMNGIVPPVEFARLLCYFSHLIVLGITLDLMNINVYVKLLEITRTNYHWIKISVIK